VPDPDPLTVAVKVTGWPRIVGFSELMTVVRDVAARAAVHETVSRAAMTPTPGFALHILSMVFSSRRTRRSPSQAQSGRKNWHGRKKNWRRFFSKLRPADP